MACSTLGYNENIQYQCQTHKSNAKPLRKAIIAIYYEVKVGEWITTRTGVYAIAYKDVYYPHSIQYNDVANIE